MWKIFKDDDHGSIHRNTWKGLPCSERDSYLYGILSQRKSSFLILYGFCHIRIGLRWLSSTFLSYIGIVSYQVLKYFTLLIVNSFLDLRIQILAVHTIEEECTILWVWSGGKAVFIYLLQCIPFKIWIQILAIFCTYVCIIKPSSGQILFIPNLGHLLWSLQSMGEISIYNEERQKFSYYHWLQDPQNRNEQALSWYTQCTPNEDFIMHYVQEMAKLWNQFLKRMHD